MEQLRIDPKAQSFRYETKIAKLENETDFEFELLVQFISFRNIEELAQKYQISITEIYEISNKLNWKDRSQYYTKCSHIGYLKNKYADLYQLNERKKDNLIRIAESIQNQIYNFLEYIALDAKEIKLKDHNPHQKDIVRDVRQSTRALMDIYKLQDVINKKLKEFYIDLSPEALQKFEEEILFKPITDELTSHFENIFPNEETKTQNQAKAKTPQNDIAEEENENTTPKEKNEKHNYSNGTNITETRKLIKQMMKPN